MEIGQRVKGERPRCHRARQQERKKLMKKERKKVNMTGNERRSGKRIRE